MTEAEFVPLHGVAGHRAAFIPRLAGVDVDADRETALQRLAAPQCDYLKSRGFDPSTLATAEQVHGGEVAVAVRPVKYEGVDALVTGVRGLTLGIYVADCAAVYLADRRGRAIGLVHSGRAGTAANITARSIALLQSEFGVPPTDLVIHLSPCIRPPLYETDFAAEIVAQARAAGATDVRDDRICTGRRMDRYYSYRMEKGRTGRMLAALALLP